METERKLELDIVKLVEQLGLDKEKMLESVFNKETAVELHNVSQ